MDYGGGYHYTADHGCVWLFGHRSKSVGAGSAYRLYARSVCNDNDNDSDRRLGLTEVADQPDYNTTDKVQ